MKQVRWFTALMVGGFLLSLSALASAATLYEVVPQSEGTNDASYWVTYGQQEFGETWICEKRDVGDENNNLTAGAPPAGSVWGAIIVKQGTDNYVFREVEEGDELPTGGAYSHYIECWMDAGLSIEVVKTAETSYDRTHDWSIDKEVTTDKDLTHDGFPKIWLYSDGSSDETATWSIDLTYEGFVDGNFVVEGEITIKNVSTAGTTKTVDSIVDDLGFSGYGDIDLECKDESGNIFDPATDLPKDIAYDETWTCTYDEVLDGADASDSGTNEVEVVVKDDPNDYSATAGWSFGDPDEFDATVNISDVGTPEQFGPTSYGPFNASDYDPGDVIQLADYTNDFAFVDYDDQCGADLQFDNTATIDETSEFASVSLLVNVRCEELTVEKTAVTSYARTHDWSIDKEVTTDNGLTHGEDDLPKIWLYTDGQGDETATWSIDLTYVDFEDHDYNVEGTITIENTGQLDAVITSVDDTLAGTPITVDCPVDLPSTLEVGETLTCTYDEDVASKISGDNEASVTTERDTYDADAVTLTWGDPDDEFDATVNISDVGTPEQFGPTSYGPFNASDYTPGQVIELTDYTNDFAWVDYGAGGCGDFVYENTATIDETDENASATLLVNVQCYLDETAYAEADSGAQCFIPDFSQWGWTNPIDPGTYTWDLWAGAAQCDTGNGTYVGFVTVDYDADGYVEVTYNLESGYSLEETHVYAGYDEYPTRGRRSTVAPGQYDNDSPFDGSTVYVIVHVVVGLPDPDFGP